MEFISEMAIYSGGIFQFNVWWVDTATTMPNLKSWSLWSSNSQKRMESISEIAIYSGGILQVDGWWVGTVMTAPRDGPSELKTDTERLERLR